VQLLGISSGDPFTQKTFADSLELPYPLLSDHPDPKVIRSYGVIRASRRDPKRMLARPSFFLIDKQGIVRRKWFRERGTVFPNERLLKGAREIAATR